MYIFKIQIDMLSSSKLDDKTNKNEEHTEDKEVYQGPQEESINDIIMIGRMGQDDMNDTPPRKPFLPINIRTRGQYDYTQIGVISALDYTTPEDSPVLSGRHILPLYGRPTYQGSQKWNFYTTTDGFHLLRIPIFYKNRNCTTEQGCEELYDEDYVRVEEYGSTFKVRLYESNQYRYIPHL